MVFDESTIRESVYRCGEYLDGDIYPVFRTPGKRRKRFKPTRQTQERLNLRNSRRRLLRLLRTNFHENELHLTITYENNELPETPQAAERLICNYLQRLRRLFKKSSIPLKYVRITERGKNGRYHHHIVLSGGIDRDRLERLWRHGRANCDRLQFDDDGLAGLAKYLTKERVCFRRWSGSINLVRPEPEQHDGRISFADAEEAAECIEAGNAYSYFKNLYPGYELTSCSAERNEINRGIYIRFEMRRIRKNKNGKYTASRPIRENFPWGTSSPLRL